ncbi:L,D-transpeptidase family protein [Flavobacterium terrigena]|uniref:Murein L,D-transpeptidase YcbB/YkuD n=1 Tax=Flavobacterium terrigena TaxID=402734 RepID=A0A1H6QLF2_9FLAO|nr:L,D-transpeptidase family protein [Flavobacterium terrigena]SEI39832.1 Murein L,D-transpeptidase YcbB/YkuD [Flavobacterium terrigena]
MKNAYLLSTLLFFLFSCKKTDQNSADLILGKATINAFFKANPESKKIEKEVESFYQNRNFEYAWFTKNGMTQAVSNFQNQLQNYSFAFNDKTFKDEQLDTLISNVKSNYEESKIDVKQRENLELQLTTTFFKYSEKAFAGIKKTPRQLDWFIPRSKKNFQATLESLILKDENDSIYQPVNIYYSKLVEKLILYREIKKKGGFPIIKTDKKALSITQSDPCLIQVKQHLFLSEDLKSNDKTMLFTESLKAAVSNFQQRLGLPETGILDTKTIIEMNKSVDFRIKQMLVNLERLRWVPVEVESDYLLVNIPEYKLHVFKDKKIFWETNVVVGKEANETAIFKGKISRIMLNPYWNIPNSIINKEILPAIKKDKNYLSKNNMEVVSYKGEPMKESSINWNEYTKNVPFIIRQKPGNDNALGEMKFLFPNNFSIYLHDTPSKELFDRNKRDFSHGCIRVENPKKLMLYLLENDKTWTQEKLDEVLKTDTETGISVKPNMPVYIAYFTAWVDHKGNLNFRNDIYNLDDKLAKEIFAD